MYSERSPTFLSQSVFLLVVVVVVVVVVVYSAAARATKMEVVFVEEKE